MIFLRLLFYSLLLSLSFNLLAQVDYQEHTITCDHEPDLTFRIDSNTTIITVTTPIEYCAHSQIFFLRNGEVISEKTEAASRLKEIIRVGDKIFVTGEYLSHGSRGPSNFFKLEFDLNGNFLGENIGYKKVYGDLFGVSEAGLVAFNKGYISLDNDGEVLIHFFEPDEELITIPLNPSWEIDNLLLLTGSLLGNINFPDWTHFLMVGPDFIATAPTSQILDNGSYNHRTLDSVIYAGILLQQEVVTLSNERLHIWDANLRVAYSRDIPFHAEAYRIDGSYLLGWNKLNEFISAGDTLTEIEIKRIDLFTLDEVLIDTIFHNLSDWKLLLNNNELQVFGNKIATPELVVQRFDLSKDKEIEVIPTELGYLSHHSTGIKVLSNSAEPVISADFEVSIFNESNYTVESLLIWDGNYRYWECNFPSFESIPVLLLPQQESIFSLKDIRSKGFSFVNDGDTIVFNFGCIKFYPLGTPADISLSNNEFCPQLTIRQTTLSARDITASENRIVLTPNPASEMLLVRLQDITSPGLEYSILNISGNLIWKGNTLGNVNELEIDVSNIPNGLYILHLTDSSSGILNASRRFVVQR